MPYYEVEVTAMVDSGYFVVKADSEEEAVEKAWECYEGDLAAYSERDTSSCEEVPEEDVESGKVAVDID